MSPAEIRGVRDGLGLSQAEVGRLLGCHAMTVSRWERGAARPSTYQESLLGAFGRAATTGGPELGRKTAELLISHGMPAALVRLLSAVFPTS